MHRHVLTVSSVVVVVLYERVERLFRRIVAVLVVSMLKLVSVAILDFHRLSTLNKALILFPIITALMVHHLLIRMVSRGLQNLIHSAVVVIDSIVATVILIIRLFC